MKDFETKVLNVGGGLFYNLGNYLQVVSKVTYISKDNINTTKSITNPLIRLREQILTRFYTEFKLWDGQQTLWPIHLRTSVFTIC